MAKIGINLKEGKIEEKEIILGIDLGTTNSLIARVPEGSLVPVAIPGAENEVIVPSVVHFDEDGNALVGRAARKKLTEAPERTIYSVKRLLGKSYNDISDHSSYFSYKIIDDDTEGLVKIRVGDKFYSPIELSSEILKELKFRAEKALDAKVRKVVITVPAYFNDSQRQATRDAGKLAGLEVLRIVNEPTAASLAYGIGLNPSDTRKVAVYDLGGGTFDISILQIEQGVFEVLSTHGDTYLGGDDLDRAVVDFWMEKYGLSNLSSDDVQRLRLLAEEAKIYLSDNDVFNGKFNDLSVGLTRKKFNELIIPIVERTLVSCKEAMNDSGLKINEIDEVVMVGGSTRVPLVRSEVSRFFENKDLHIELDPDIVVALGAAVEADILAGNRKDILLLDVTPLSLGIETLGGLMDVLIPRNSKIPAKVGRQYTTSVDGQVNIQIGVFQGERDQVSENRKLAEFDLKGIPAMPAGLPKVEVSFMLDADGILQVGAKELRSGTEQNVIVRPQYGLTDQDVERMLMESLENAESDMQHRALIEAKTEAEQLIYATERFIDNNAAILSENEVSTTQKLVEALKTEISNKVKDRILAAQDELNEYTRPFAERAMDAAVGNALKGKKI